MQTPEHIAPRLNDPVAEVAAPVGDSNGGGGSCWWQRDEDKLFTQTIGSAGKFGAGAVMQYLDQGLFADDAFDGRSGRAKITWGSCQEGSGLITLF
jgi:hypothetical protein